MKLATQPVDIEKSADFDSIMMGIGNEVMIMEFLRNNLYSNKIGIVVQEYMSNARDAHRESGIPDRPIEVTIPTQLKPEFRVRDFGPGIDHDRMEGAFAQYGISTKNQDDEATGGFGIGCMSGFSYTDSFTVVVILPDREMDQFVKDAIEESGIDMDILIEDGWVDSNRTKRTYVCYIDETRAGTIDLVDTQPTDEPVGTTIIIPCKKGDMREFRDQVVRVTQWWDDVPNSARPIIHGDHLSWPSRRLVYTNEEGRWSIQEKRNHYGDDPQDAPFVILDGIPYPLNLASIYPRRDMEDQSDSIFDDEEEVSPIPDFASALFSVPLRMQFNTGELTVAVSREALDYGMRTRQALRERIKSIHQWICDVIDEEIGTVTNLWEACAKWRDIKRKFAFIEVAAEWQGFKLFSEMEIPTRSRYGSAKDCTALYTYHWGFNDDDDFRLQKEPANSWHDEKIIPSTDIILVEDDTDFTRPPKSKMRTVMLNIPEDERKDAVVKVVKFRKSVDKDKMDKEYSWTAGLKPILLSQVEKTLKVRPKAPPPKQVKVRVIDANKWHFYEPDDKVDFKTGSGIYVAQYRGRYICDPDNFHPDKDYSKCKLLSEDKIHNFCSRWDIKVHAILERYTRKLGPGWECFADFVRRKLQEESQDPKYEGLLWLDPEYNADQMRSDTGFNIFWYNYRIGGDNGWLDNMNDPVLKEWLATSVKYYTLSSEINWLKHEMAKWGLPTGESFDLEDTVNILKDKYGTAVRYLDTYPTSFSYEERNRRDEIVAEYFSFFTKYLNLIELEKRLGEKS